MPVTEEKDLFLDEEWAPLDTRTGPEAGLDLVKLVEENPEFAPHDLESPAEPTAETPVVPAKPAATEEPEVIELQDGGTLTIARTKRGWKAALDGGTTAGVESFYGTTKDDLFRALAVAKLNATKKINQQERQIKLGDPQQAQPAQVYKPVKPTVRNLTADEKFELKADYQADPDVAIRKWFEKSVGLSVEQLVALATEGANKSRENAAVAEINFIENRFNDTHERYDPTWDNYVAIIQWMSRNYLGRTTGATKNDIYGTAGELYEKGLYTLEKLSEAYDDLAEAGLLSLFVDESEVVPEVPVAPVAPAPIAPTPSRIDRTRRPRAGLGLRASETTTVPPVAEQPPSAEALEDLSNDDIAKLLSGVRRIPADERRRLMTKPR